MLKIKHFFFLGDFKLTGMRRIGMFWLDNYVHQIKLNLACLNGIELANERSQGGSIRSPRIDPPGWESILGRLKRFTNSGSELKFFKRLRSLGIDSKEFIPPAYMLGYISWRNRFLGIDSWAP